MCLLTVPSASYPLVHATAAPIMRYAREVWAHAHAPKDHKPGDLLSARELSDLWWAVKQVKHPLKKNPQGPVRAIAASLLHLGWTFKSPTTVLTRNGDTMDITIGTPRMLHTYIVADFHHKANGTLTTNLRDKGTWTSDEDPDWVTIREFLVHEKNTTA